MGSLATQGGGGVAAAGLCRRRPVRRVTPGRRWPWAPARRPTPPPGRHRGRRRHHGCRGHRAAAAVAAHSGLSATSLRLPPPCDPPAWPPGVSRIGRGGHARSRRAGETPPALSPTPWPLPLSPHIMSGGTPIAGLVSAAAPSLPSPTPSWSAPSALHPAIAPRVALPVAPYYAPSGWGASPSPAVGSGAGRAAVSATPPTPGHDGGGGGSDGNGDGGGDDNAGRTPVRMSLTLPSARPPAGLASPFSVSPAWSSGRPTAIVRDAEMLKAAWLLSEFATPPPPGSGRTDEGGRGGGGDGGGERRRDGWEPLGGSGNAAAAMGLPVAHSPGCTPLPAVAAGKWQGGGGGASPAAVPPSLPPPPPSPSPPPPPPPLSGRARKRGGSAPQALRGAPAGGASKKRRGPVGLMPLPPARGAPLSSWSAAPAGRGRPPPAASATVATALPAALPPPAGQPLPSRLAPPLSPLPSVGAADGVWPSRGRPTGDMPAAVGVAAAAAADASAAVITHAGSPPVGGPDVPISPVSGGRTTTDGSGRSSSSRGGGSGDIGDGSRGSIGAHKEDVHGAVDRQLPLLPPIQPATVQVPTPAARTAALASALAIDSVPQASTTHAPAAAPAIGTVTASATAAEDMAMAAASAAAAAAVEVPPSLAPGGAHATAGGTRLSALARAKARARLAADRFAELRKVAKASESDTAVAAVAAARAAAEADGGTPASRSRLTYMQYRRRLQLNQQSAAVSRVYRQRYPDELEAEVRAVEASLAAAGGVAAVLRAENGQLRAAVEAAARGRGWGGHP